MIGLGETALALLQWPTRKYFRDSRVWGFVGSVESCAWSLYINAKQVWGSGCGHGSELLTKCFRIRLHYLNLFVFRDIFEMTTNAQFLYNSMTVWEDDLNRTIFVTDVNAHPENLRWGRFDIQYVADAPDGGVINGRALSSREFHTFVYANSYRYSLTANVVIQRLEMKWTESSVAMT